MVTAGQWTTAQVHANVRTAPIWGVQVGLACTVGTAVANSSDTVGSRQGARTGCTLMRVMTYMGLSEGPSFLATTVATMWTVNLLCNICSTHRHNLFRAELFLHAVTCVVGWHALLIHEHTKVIMVAGLTPRSLPGRQRSAMRPSSTRGMIQGTT